MSILPQISVIVNLKLPLVCSFQIFIFLFYHLSYSTFKFMMCLDPLYCPTFLIHQVIFSLAVG